MPEAFIISVNADALDRSDRRLLLVLDDSPERAIDAVRRLWPTSELRWTGIKALRETVEKLELRQGEPKQL
jgi:hypothetical protein